MTETVDQRVEIARDYLQGARQRDVQHLPPTRLMVEVAETRHQLAQVLAVIGDQEDAAGKLAEVRSVLAAFDWEFDDQQLALERIERIVAEHPAGVDSESWACRGCGGSYIGRRPADDLCRDCTPGGQQMRPAQ